MVQAPDINGNRLFQAGSRRVHFCFHPVRLFRHQSHLFRIDLRVQRKIIILQKRDVCLRQTDCLIKFPIFLIGRNLFKIVKPGTSIEQGTKFSPVLSAVCDLVGQKTNRHQPHHPEKNATIEQEAFSGPVFPAKPVHSKKKGKEREREGQKKEFGTQTESKHHQNDRKLAVVWLSLRHLPLL